VQATKEVGGIDFVPPVNQRQTNIIAGGRKKEEGGGWEECGTINYQCHQKNQ
jgi:hypothetical protein